MDSLSNLADHFRALDPRWRLFAAAGSHWRPNMARRSNVPLSDPRIPASCKDPQGPRLSEPPAACDTVAFNGIPRLHHFKCCDRGVQAVGVSLAGRESLAARLYWCIPFSASHCNLSYSSLLSRLYETSYTPRPTGLLPFVLSTSASVKSYRVCHETSTALPRRCKIRCRVCIGHLQPTSTFANNIIALLPVELLLILPQPHLTTRFHPSGLCGGTFRASLCQG